ncbi:hypothetical protein [Aquipseudomonas ullengensis]|uniref:Uncharacterized protein n=1 Tax=Aquipseudomonas ullengensis TaxID=2759166 RepID=A0A7W4QAT4_9GAMM|nr:hypothetical protein [Pseudomonas ullengensis]MBB2496172.1 hypothetical protein [Pseudomonas ullengensis]
MLRIDVGQMNDNLVLGVQRQAARERGETVAPETVKEGLRVSLSELGRIQSVAKNDDIDESNLPDTVKEILKMMRALKQQIAEKKQELEAVMADQSLSPEARQVRVEALRGELNALQGALSSASANLIKVMREAGLSAEQKQTAAKLAMA